MFGKHPKYDHILNHINRNIPNFGHRGLESILEEEEKRDTPWIGRLSVTRVTESFTLTPKA